MKYAVWLTDAALVAGLKAQAKREGRKINALTERALRAYLGGVPVERPGPAVTESNGEPGHRVAAATSQTQRRSRPTPVVPASLHEAIVRAPYCRRCQHPEAKHYGTLKQPQPRCQIQACACARFL